MREPADVAKTNPLTEKPATSSEWAVTFTPVDVPTRQVDDAVSQFVPSIPVSSHAHSSGNAGTAFERSAESLTCHSCGALSDGIDLFCITCGEFLEVGEKQDESVEHGVAAASGVPLCGDCGTEATEGEIFCLNCGAVLP